MVAAVKVAPVMLAWFALPSVTLFVFYAFMQMHDRYFLSSVLFVSVFAGVGVEMIWRFIHWGGNVWLRKEQHRHILACAIPFVVAAGIITTMLVVGKQMRPWGPEVTASEVKTWQALLATLEPSQDGRLRIAVEQRCRYLEDLLLSYSDVDILDPKHIDAWPEDWSPAYYFDPQNHQAEYATPQWLMYLQAYAKSLLQDRMNVIESAMPVPVLGGGQFDLYQLTPWQSGDHQQVVERSLDDPVLWFDWGIGAGEQQRSVTIRSNAEKSPVQQFSSSGAGLEAVFLSSDLEHATNLLVQVKSDVPVAAAPVIATGNVENPHWMELGPRKRISAYRLFESKSSRHHTSRHYPVLRTLMEDTIRAPRMIGKSHGLWRVTLSGDFRDDADIVVKVASDSMPPQLINLGKGLNAFVFLVLQDSTAKVTLTSSVYPMERTAFVVRQIGFVPYEQKVGLRQGK
jgi:hypothetical protein